MTFDFQHALNEWRSIVGQENVVASGAALDAAATTTFSSTQRVRAVVSPVSAEEVKGCVGVANKYKIPLYPVSGGKNWGYGSRVPVQDNSVVLDLGKTARILDFDEKLAYVTVEPGVTFQQLYEFLQEKKSGLITSVIGSTGHASLVGNLIERGLGRGPNGDRFAHVCALEVVLPTGHCVHTGFSRFANAKSSQLHRWGVGPYVDGLFTQSNFGIVTKATLWLTPLSEHFQTFFFSLNDDTKLEGLAETLRVLRLEGTIRSAFSIINDYRFISSQRQYPWQTTNGQTPLPADILETLRNSGPWGGIWNGECALYSASKEQARADRQRIERALKGKVDKLMFMDQKKARLMRWLRRPLSLFIKADMGAVVDRLYTNSSFRGVPSDKAITTAYWRKKSPPPDKMDPDRDHCGVIWFSPVIPFVGGDIRAAVDLVRTVVSAHGFEPSIGLNCFSERSIDLTAVIFYDRETPGEDARAMACHHDLFAKLTDAGYIPYRLGIHSMTLLPPPTDDSNYLLDTLKSSLDPNRILAPGRYEFHPVNAVPDGVVINPPFVSNKR
jgi:4-cresol dehydrogenase (hydroxylating) flavoprotein subunit